VEIGNWSATQDLNAIYRELRDLGLETNVAELEAFGFTVVRNALSPQVTDRLREAVLREAERRFDRSFDLADETDLAGWTLIPYLLCRDPIFEEALLNPGPLALVTYLVGNSCLLSSLTSHFKGPGGEAIPLHADNSNGAPPPMPPYSQVCNCNYALTDYREELGSFAVVPGSHRLARKPTPHEAALHGPDRNPQAIPLEVPAGSAIVYHGNTWHGSFRRDAPGLRINLSMFFCRQYIATQEIYKNRVPDEVLQRHRDNDRFMTLIGERTYYGWTEEGPDRNFADYRAGISWHA